MKLGTSVWILVCLALFFTFVSNAILSIKMLQFRNQLIKSQIMNYEFSSKALREKFKLMLSNSEDIRSEIQSNVLESSILNFDKLTVTSNLTMTESIGLVIVNIVRKLSLKTFMRFLDEQENLTKLQYAFLLERNQRCKNASEKYKELEEDLHDIDDLSFVRLHSGYCLAIVGERRDAISKLETIINSNSGTHFSDSAEILLSVLRETERRKIEIQEKHTDPHQIAKAYFNSGQYFEAYRNFSTISDLSLREKYMKARSMERIGKTSEAISDYFELSEQQMDRQVALESNRRLLVLGKVYDAGDKVTKIAEKKAVELNDNSIVSMVNEVTELKLQPIVLEKLKKDEKGTDSRVKNFTVNEDQIILPQMIESRALLLEQNEILPQVLPNRLLAFLADGRVIKGNSFKIKNSEVFMQSNYYEMSFPYSMLLKVEAEVNGKTNHKKSIILIKLSGNRNLMIESLERTDDALYFTRKENRLSYSPNELMSATVK